MRLRARGGPVRAKPELRPDQTHDHTDTEPALEVIVQWGDSVLYAEHVRAPGELVLGEPEPPAQSERDRATKRGGKRRNQAVFAFDLAPAGMERVVLARHDGQRAWLLVPSAFGALGWIDGAAIDVAALDHDGGVELPEAADGVVELCGLRVYVRATHVAREASLRAGDSSRVAQPWTLASLGAHLLVLALFYVVPPHSQALSMNDVDPRSRLVKFTIDARTRELETPPSMTEPGKEGEGTQGKAAPGDSGAMGDPKAPKAPRRAASRGSSPTPSLATAPVDASKQGILGLLHAAAPTLASHFSAQTAIGSDAEDALGALIGDRIGASFGHGGLGMIGTGHGGGGDPTGTIGLGRLGTFGVGTGKKGYGFGADGSGLGPRGPRVPPRLTVEPPVVAGGLSKEVIRRVVHRHLAEVRHCYEQRLIARPDLQGRVSVRFVIGGSGLVAASAVMSSTVDDTSVGLCIAQATRRWVFPAPEGSGIVSVTYPFVLQHAGR
jgi:hypothetical protein